MRNLSDTIARLAALRLDPGQMPDDHGRLSELTDFESNPGALRARTYVPEKLDDGAALVVVLHGCTQTAAGYDIGSGWSQVADRHGFALLFPEAVSGYLFDPDVGVRDPGSTHAWAEVYLPTAGWIAFDPTHRRVGSSNLIAIAVGRCNSQIMPIRGGFTGAPDDFLGMDVRVSVVPL
ncbi:PHB depolymerase family esterase [Sphingobium sp. EM0848]|uniref:PHB depolymerase family esterase n=1 Tax=Sphingobium sp. EM0848 TaxID=2743473 RepID=UPI00159C15B9